MIKVYELLDLINDISGLTVNLYDLISGSTIFTCDGSDCELCWKLADLEYDVLEVLSVDIYKNRGGSLFLELNVEIEEEENE